MKANIITFGCTQNQSDSQLMAGVLDTHGYEIVNNPSDADVVIINSCTVKNNAETKLRRAIRAHHDKKIIIAGCIPQAEQSLLQTEFKNLSVLGTSRIGDIATVADKTLQGKVVHALTKTNIHREQKLDLPFTKAVSPVTIIPISEGCLSSCTYCKTKAARGGLYSYSEGRILARAQEAIAQGAKEIWLTSQDCAVWGVDRQSNIAQLLKRISALPGDFKIRLGMANPDYIYAMADELIEAFTHKKVFKFLHLPVQAGSDRVLRHMKRKYTTQQFKEVVEKFRAAIPDLTVATDVICGYPTETDEDFKKTLTLMNEVCPEVMNISRFWPRPNTPAAALEQLSPTTIRRRTEQMMRLHKKLVAASLAHWVGWQGEVIIDAKKQAGSVMARNDSYIPIAIPQELPLGSVAAVELTAVHGHYLKAKVIAH